MDIRKSGQPIQPIDADSEIDAVNHFTKTKLAPDDVFTFSVLLCDNEVDRDSERFSIPTLRDFRDLFLGKTGIADHDWSTDRQIARIYRTDLISDPQKTTSAGEPYTYLRAWAYILRSPRNEDIIRDINGGIKRETSVGCSVAHRICSVCGKDALDADCGHIPGMSYAGKPCHHILDGAVDAYEWSFVAVPAQKNAGVIKHLQPQSPELDSLRKKAAVADSLLEDLRRETLRLALTCERELGSALEKSLSNMDADALLPLRDSLRKRALSLFPPVSQLPNHPLDPSSRDDHSEFLI
ncbi:MAG: hypothetical protein Q4A39_02025 [Eubacteriales bacterium]|nr:hypothetical protein [Eubacteriales bacterium]